MMQLEEFERIEVDGRRGEADQVKLALDHRRLRDAGLSVWWQLISLAPVAGIIALLYLCTFPTKTAKPAEAADVAA